MAATGSAAGHQFQAYLKGLKALAKQLQTLPATGPAGFEGLVANALAELSGLEIRLAKSGLQQGRDGSSPPGPFSIAFEAKRYERNLRLEDIAAKAWSAAHELDGVIDLWALCATSEVGDETVRKLNAMLDDRGITLLLLDWVQRPIPPLAVAVAAAPETTLRWFAQHHSTRDRARLAGHLEQIAGHPAFGDSAARLGTLLHAAHVGLDSLRRKSSAWLRARLTDRNQAQDTFGQFVAVADPSISAVARGTTLGRVKDAVDRVESGSQPAVVAVIGEEGGGKTWVVAQWLLPTLDQLVPLWIGGPQVQHVVPDDPMETLARVCAAQHDGGLERWRHRIRRWRLAGWPNPSSTAAGARHERRFAVVLDGLNENPDVRWDAVIRMLGGLVEELGGVLLVTCRPHFWREEVKPRLGTRVTVREITVEGYDDDELKQVLEKARIDLAAVPERVRDFIRNPRVCAVAVQLLDRLTLAPEDLTIDRLLLDYWHARLEERGGLLLHSSEAFHELLRRHAREWLAGERNTFSRDDIAEYSSVAKRRGIEALRQDVSDIEDGRFMTIDAANPSRYTFRQEALPFAIGLSVQHELRVATTGPTGWRGSGLEPQPAPEAVLNGLLDPIQGFDRLSEVLCAAVGLACLDTTYPGAGLRALILAWLNLQNQGAGALADEMSAYVALKPDPFLDVAESANVRFYDGRAAHSLPSLLIARRDAPRVQQAFVDRAARWLGMWSRNAAQRLPPDAQEEQDKRRAAERESRIAELRPTELARFDTLATEVAAAPNLDLVELTARFLVGRPLAPHAEALLGWAMVRAITPDPTSSSETLAWVVRLNRVDAEATRRAVHALAAKLDEQASEPVRHAVAILLRLLGDRDSVSQANALHPTHVVRGWRRAETYCDTDPFDPGSAEPTNLGRAHDYVAGLAHTDVWVAMSRTTHDADVETVMPGLTRFAPPTLIELLQGVARTAPDRIGMPLRQLAWHLPEHSPVFDGRCAEAIHSAVERLLDDSGRAPERDLHWVLANLTQALAPHGTGEAHVARVLSLPLDMPLFLSLLDGMPPVAPARWVEILGDAYAALEAGDKEPLTRVLLLLNAPAQPRVNELGPGALDVITAALAVSHGDVAQCAAELIRSAGDAALDDRLLQMVVDKKCEARRSDLQFARALAEIVVRRARTDLLSLVDQDYVGAAIDRLAETDARLAVAYFDDALRTLAEHELPSVPAEDFTVVIPRTEQGMNRRWAIEDSDHGLEEDPDLVWSEQERNGQAVRVLDVAASEERTALRRLEFQKAVEEHLTLARRLGAVPFDAPGIGTAGRAMVIAPASARRWLEQVERTSQLLRGWQVRSLGVVLASAYAALDAETAARVLRTLRDVGPIRIRVESDGVELWDHALFCAADTPPIAALRREVFDEAGTDERLETLVTAAETCGASDWLDSYVQSQLSSASVGDQARGLAICGLRRAGSLADDELGKEWGDGFLGATASQARGWRARAAWTAMWMSRASETTDPLDFWRFGTLAVGVADVRYMSHQDALLRSWGIRRFGSSVCERLRQARKRRSKKRSETLFGHRVWDRDVVIALCLKH